MSEKKNPVQILIEKRESVIGAYEAGKGPKGAWNVLEKEVPEIAESMTFNTFKQYVTPFVQIAAEYESKLQEVSQEVHKLREREREVLERLESASKTPKKEGSQEVHNKRIENINGWNIYRNKDGYFRMHRKYGGLAHSIYLGKVFDREKAIAKIEAKEKELGIQNIEEG